MRIKIAVLVVLLLVGLLVTTCDLLPPETALWFNFYNWDAAGWPDVVVDFELENVGEYNLQNCKLYFEFVITGLVDDPQRWTAGIDLDVDEYIDTSHTFDFSGWGGTDCTSVELIGAGWDNPPDD